MFKEFGRKMQRDIKKTVDARLAVHEELNKMKVCVILRYIFFC